MDQLRMRPDLIWGRKIVRFFRKIPLVLAPLVIAATGAHAAETLRFNQWLPPKHFVITRFVQPWVDDVKRVTDGRVLVEYTASSLGAPPRQYQLARDGVADVVWNTHGYTPGQFPLTEIAELPFLGNSAEAVSVAYWRIFERYLAKSDEHKGTHVIGLHAQPPGQIFNTKRPIVMAKDMQGLKLRTPGRTASVIAKLYGAAPIAAPSTKQYEMLERGVIDGTFFSIEAVASFKLEQFVKYESTAPGGFYNLSFFLVMNDRKWKSISAADRAAIDKVSGEVFARRVGHAYDEMGKIARAKLTKGGLKSNAISAELLADMKKRTAFIEENWIKMADKKGLDGKAIVAAFRAEIAKLEAGGK